ncbi:MAG: hypothetical protein KDB14_15510, partial [Planctomycetales bacterium]|nr:hypothetical protein [Planctomycetales bacterium]
FKKQLIIMQGLVDADPNVATRLHGLAEAHKRLGVCAQQKQDWLTAAEHLGRAVNIGWRMVNADSRDSLHMYAHVVRVCVYDHAYRMAHPGEEPHTRVPEAVELAKELVQLEPEVPLNREALALACFRMMMGVADGRDPVALETYARDLLSAIDGYIAIAGRTPQIVWWRSSGNLYLANARRAQGDARGADEAFRQAVNCINEALAAGIDDPVLRIHLAELLQDDPAATREERIAAINAARDSVLSARGAKPAHVANVGRLYHAAGEFESAMDMLLRAQAKYEHLGADLSAEDAQALRECQSLVGD